MTTTPENPALKNLFLPAYSAPPGRDYDPRYGGVPAVPNPLFTAQQAIGGDLALMDDLKNLGRSSNKMLFGQYTSRMPGYSDIAAQSSKNISSLLKGAVPEDVLYLLQQQGAERGVGAGVGGSPFENSEYLRALGLTSLDLMGKGEDQFTGSMSRLKDIPFFNLTDMFVKPEDVQAAGTEAAKLATAPNPAAVANNELAKLKSGLGAGASGGNPAGNYAWDNSDAYWNTFRSGMRG